MSNTKLKAKFDVITGETISSDFATSKTLSGGGATIPANAGEIICIPSAAAYWNPVGTATTSFMHAVAANEPFLISAKHQSTAEIIGVSGAIDLVVIYMRGAGRADRAYSAQSRPF